LRPPASRACAHHAHIALHHIFAHHINGNMLVARRAAVARDNVTARGKQHIAPNRQTSRDITA